MEKNLKDILSRYQQSFLAKQYDIENEDHDLLMDVFSIEPATKRENRQYWGRELGMCWQKLITEVARLTCEDFQPALKVGDDEPADLFIGEDAIDTKYRIGSGDSGTLKKFKKYGELFRQQGYTPTLLILREDNLPAAITACRHGGWRILTGDASFAYIKEKTGFDMKGYLMKNRHVLSIKR